jgi:phosphoglycerate dehydrogenase-like enzyme
MKILVVMDGTGTCDAIVERLRSEISRKDLSAKVETFAIDRVPGVRLQDRGDINEFMGRPEHLAANIGEADVLVVHLAPVDEATIAADPSLELIACARGGPVNVDLHAATARGIPVLYCPGRNAQAVAEFTIGLVIAVARGIAKGDSTAREGLWRNGMDRNRFIGPELLGKTMGIVGMGNIGQVVAKIALALGMTVVAHDPQPLSNPPSGVELMSLDSLLEVSDFVSLHARAVSGAPPLMGAREFALMKKSAILVNTARGALVDERALREAIEAGRIAGAGLDVLSEEPPADSNPVVGLPNVLVTPHIAGISTDTAEWSAKLLVEDVLRFLEGGSPLNMANAIPPIDRRSV